MSEPSEREAFHLAIRNAFRAESPDFLPCLVFADWLDERGETELASGLRALARLRVTVRPDQCIYNGVNATDGEDGLTAKREEGRLWFVTEAWWNRVDARRDQEWADAGGVYIPFADHLEYAALGWADLTPAQQEKAEALLGVAETATEVSGDAGPRAAVLSSSSDNLGRA